MKEVTKERFDEVIATVMPECNSHSYFYGVDNRMLIRTRVKDMVFDVGAIVFGYGYSVEGGKADQVAMKYYVNSCYE